MSERKFARIFDRYLEVEVLAEAAGWAMVRVGRGAEECPGVVHSEQLHDTPSKDAVEVIPFGEEPR